MLQVELLYKGGVIVEGVTESVVVRGYVFGAIIVTVAGVVVTYFLAVVIIIAKPNDTVPGNIVITARQGAHDVITTMDKETMTIFLVLVSVVLYNTFSIKVK